MYVEIIDATLRPVTVISQAAGCSYGKYDVNVGRVKHCYKNRHMSVFEHAHITFRITDISRACCDQLTRHRMASFVVKSQRYTEPICHSTDPNEEWYVSPPSFNLSSELLNDYHERMAELLADYEAAIDGGVKYEDARFLLPMATKTDMVMTVNVRELFHMFEMRLDKAAQWEIQKLFLMIQGAIYRMELEEWIFLMDLYDEDHQDNK